MFKKFLRRVRKSGEVGKRTRQTLREHRPDFILIRSEHRQDQTLTGSGVIFFASEITRKVVDGHEALVPIKALGSNYIRYIHLETGKTIEMQYKDILKNPYYSLLEIPKNRLKKIRSNYNKHKGNPIHIVFKDSHVQSERLDENSFKEIISDLTTNRKVKGNTILLIENKEGALINMETGDTERKNILQDPGELGYND